MHCDSREDGKLIGLLAIIGLWPEQTDCPENKQSSCVLVFLIFYFFLYFILNKNLTSCMGRIHSNSEPVER